jgi:ribonuclease HI
MNTIDNYFTVKESEISKEDITVFTDGSCINNGYKNACAGIGIFFGIDDDKNVSKRIMGKQSNNTAELLAIIEVFKILKSEIINNKINLLIYTDSKYCILCATTYGDKQAKKKWVDNIPNKELVKTIHTLFKKYGSIVKLAKVKAHTTKKDPLSTGNRWADKLARQSLEQKYIL